MIPGAPGYALGLMKPRPGGMPKPAIKGALIKWRSRRVWCRVRNGRVHAEPRKTSGAKKHFRDQAEIKAPNDFNVARESCTARFESPEGYVKRVSRQVSVPAKHAAGTLPDIGD